MYNPIIALLIATTLTAVLAALFWPRRGLISRWRHGRRLTKRVLSEDALKHIYACELADRRPSIASIAGTLHISQNEAAELITEMEAGGLAQTDQGQISLSDTGRETALHIIRAHRLWERYLAEETGFSEQVWHQHADQWEHAISPEEADALSAQLGHPQYDPHGDPIPSGSGYLREHGGDPLPKLDAGTIGRIIHLEDEPDVVYAQLIAEGVHLGQIVQVTESTGDRVRFWTNGDEHLLAPIVAANISVMPFERSAGLLPDSEGGFWLSSLLPGETAEVIAISPASRGAERRRLLDLGILPGTQITAEFESPSGNPVAYKIRGAVIALREDQAKHIKLKRLVAVI